jgi:amidohydrolase
MSAYQKAFDLFEYSRDLRRQFHAMPELAFMEHQTARFIAKELKSLGYQVREGIGQTGVTGILDTGKPGKTTLLRFDMDALPILEDTGHVFASKNEGIMHACGHDGHMAIGLTLARLVAENAQTLSGKVYFVYQPAEEICQGALGMIADGLFDDIVVDYTLASHLWAEKPYGWIGIPDGPVMGGSSDIYINVRGKGGHAAKPDATVDPLKIAAQIILDVQKLVPGRLPRGESAIVSITQIEASDRKNIIAETVKMAGSLRWFDETTRDKVTAQLKDICDEIAVGFGGSAQVETVDQTIPVMNNKWLASVCRQSLQALRVDIPELKVDDKYRTHLSEDFSFITRQIPSAMLLIGASKAVDGKVYPHHHPKFDIDERSISLAVASLMHIVMTLHAEKAD